MKNKIFSLLFAFILIFSSFYVHAEPEESIALVSVNNAIYKAIDFIKSDSTYKSTYIFNADFLKNALEHDSVRLLVSLSRFGYKENYNGYGAVLKDSVIKSYKTFDKLSPNKATPWHIISMGLMACGINPQDIEGENGKIDLVKDGVWARSKKTPLEKDGPEALMRGLIVMDAYTTLIDENETPTYNRDDLIKTIMTYQKEDGNFSTSSVISDPEITATAIIALAPYQHLETNFSYIRTADKKRYNHTPGDIIHQSISYLSQVQSEDGSFSSFEKDNVEIISKTLIALCSLGIDPLSDTRFIKNDENLVNALLKSQNEDGSISFSSDSKRIKSDTYHALEALVAYSRFINGQTAIYDFTDCDLNNPLKSVVKPDLKKAYNNYVQSDIFSSVDNYEELVMLIDSAENSTLTQDELKYLDSLKNKATELYNRKTKLKELNELGKHLSAPETAIGSKNSYAIKEFIKQYDALPTYDKEKITSYEGVIEKQNSLFSKTTVGYILVILIGLLAIGLIIFLAIFFIRSTPVWDYIYMKFLGGTEMFEEDEFAEDDFDMNFDTAFFFDDNESHVLPYVENEDFFTYGDPGDVSETEEELPYIENDEFIDFISRDKNGENIDDEIEIIPADEQQLPYVDNEEFFEYEYPTDDMATDQDEDFKIY